VNVKSDNQEYLILLLTGERVLLPISTVQLVLSLPMLQILPDQDPAFSGLLNYHGKGIAVYDLSQLINPSVSLKTTIDTPLILTHVSDFNMGILVTDVLGLATISSAVLQPPPSDAMSYVKALVENQNETAWVLDLEQLIIHHRLQLKHELSNE